MNDQLEDKIVEFRQYLALGHVNMDILNQASEIHELVIKQAERNVTAQETVEILGESLNQSIDQNKRYRELLESISTTNKVASEIFNKKDGKTLIGPDDILQHILRKVNKGLEETEDA